MWTNCADELPRNDMSNVIISDGNNYYVFRAYAFHIPWMFDTVTRLKHKWTYYSDKKWRDLHNGN